MSGDDDGESPVDLGPLYGRPDPQRLDRLAQRISTSIAAGRAPRSVMDQLAAWAPVAVGLAFAVAVLAWVPAFAVSPRKPPAGPGAALLQLALSNPGPGGQRPIWFKP